MMEKHNKERQQQIPAQQNQLNQNYLELPPTTPEWHSRGYLPHWEAGATAQSITFRLKDSLPLTLLDTWCNELSRLPDNEAALERRSRIEVALDKGYGECLLRDPDVGALLVDALQRFDRLRYELHAWVIMPNHVHVLMTPLSGNSLSAILHSWKSFTAKAANQLLERKGAFWLEEYFDRSIRNQKHYNCVVDYIHNNPVKAGLCAVAEDWMLSSARRWAEGRE